MFGTRRFLSDHEVFYLGPGGLFSRSWDRDWGPEAMYESKDSLIRSGDRGWNPEVSVIGPEGHMRIHGFSLRSGDRIGTLVYLDPEVVWEPGDPLGM